MADQDREPSDSAAAAREARLQVDADRAAGRDTPQEVLVCASGDRTVEPILDGRGQPIMVPDREGGGERPMTIAEARAGDAWAREAALRFAPADPSRTPDDLDELRRRLDQARGRQGRGDE